MDGFNKEVCKRLPLGEAVLRLFDFVCQEEFLQDVFDRHRGRSYESVISFPLFVQLIGDALLEHDGSGRKSFQRAEIEGELQTPLVPPMQNCLAFRCRSASDCSAKRPRG